MLLMMIYPFATDPLVTVSITILNTVGIVIVVLFVLMWRRAATHRTPTRLCKLPRTSLGRHSRTLAHAGVPV